MPNHIHGMIKIIEQLKPNNENYVAKFRCPTNDLNSIIRGYKSAVSSQIGFSVWQRNFYEHINLG
ncbi:hypothetical protein [Actinobacillus vicugnae]|uniref:hypothetical protein n=1 Tax=Actinobacillus vicugnae TaxID=2573093 RepID=UPI001FCBD5B0|nr:hypothetical protein [Actinobacillus vicugnae]